VRIVHVKPAPPLPAQHREALLAAAPDSDYCEWVRLPEDVEITRLLSEIVSLTARLVRAEAEVIRLRGFLGVPTITRRAS
jgi:hypothetical protein